MSRSSSKVSSPAGVKVSTPSGSRKMGGWFSKLSVFGSGSSSKQKELPQTIKELDDVGLLKALKEKILKVAEDQLSKKQAKSLKAALTMVWISEYEELKSRLRQQTIRQKSVQRRMDTITSLQAITRRPPTTTQTHLGFGMPATVDIPEALEESDSGGSMREAALWILNDFTGASGVLKTAKARSKTTSSTSILDSEDFEDDLTEDSGTMVKVLTLEAGGSSLDSENEEIQSFITPLPDDERSSFVCFVDSPSAKITQMPSVGSLVPSKISVSGLSPATASTGVRVSKDSSAFPKGFSVSVDSGTVVRGKLSRPSSRRTSRATSPRKKRKQKTGMGSTSRLSEFKKKEILKKEKPSDRFRRVARRAMVVNAWRSVLHTPTPQTDADQKVVAVPSFDDVVGTQSVVLHDVDSDEKVDDDGSEELPIRKSKTMDASVTQKRLQKLGTPKKLMSKSVGYATPSHSRSLSDGGPKKPLLGVRKGTGTAPFERHSVCISDEFEDIELKTSDFEHLTAGDWSPRRKRRTSITELEVSKLLSRVGHWDLDVLELAAIPGATHKVLVLTVWKALEIFDLTKFFDRTPQKFVNFLQAIEKGYLDNPYHNKCHAADVVNTVSFFLRTDFFCKHLCEMDKFAMILAAAFHDVGHNGVNNSFHVTTHSELAVMYNDKSVLENYHVSFAFQTLKKSNCDWFSALPREIRRYLRHLMIEIVLATDMSFHNEEVSLISQLLNCLKLEYAKHGARPELVAPEMCERVSGVLSLISDDSSDSSLTPRGRAKTHTAGTGTSAVASSSMIAPTPSTSSMMVSSSAHVDDTGRRKIYEDLSDVPLRISAAAAAKYEGLEGLHLCAVAEEMMESKSLPRVPRVLDERLLAMKVCVHLCDISNPAKPMPSSHCWAQKIMEEFWLQGAREKELGLAVSPMMDESRSKLETGQIGFIKFVVAPIFDVFAQLIPESQLCAEQVADNLRYWVVENEKRQRNRRRVRARTMPPKKLDEILTGVVGKMEAIAEAKKKTTPTLTDEVVTIGDFKRAVQFQAERKASTTTERKTILKRVHSDKAAVPEERKLKERIH